MSGLPQWFYEKGANPMAIRWVLNPIVDAVETDPESGDISTYQAPKVATLIEPGRGGAYQHSSVLGSTFALSFVRADDFSAIDLDGECVNLLERDYDDAESFLARTPRGEGWSAARLNRVLARLSARGIDITGLTRDTDFAAVLRRLGRALDMNFEPLHTGSR